MANENNNNRPAWVRRLDELKSLEGQTVPDINEAWERYESMFKKEPVKKRHQWSWMAAACLAGVLLLTWKVSNNSKTTPWNSKLDHPSNKQNKISQQVSNVAELVTTPALPTTAIKSKVSSSAAKSIKKLPKVERAKPFYLHPGTGANPNKEIAITAIKNTSKPANKFAVVYNNELEEGNGASDQYQAKWTTKANQSQYPTNIQSSILKLKIPL